MKNLKLLICLAILMIFGSNLSAQDNDYTKGYTKKNFKIDYVNLVPEDSFALVSKTTFIKLHSAYYYGHDVVGEFQKYKDKVNKEIMAYRENIDALNQKIITQDSIQQKLEENIKASNTIIVTQQNNIDLYNENISILNGKLDVAIDEYNKIKRKSNTQKWLIRVGVAFFAGKLIYDNVK